MEYQKLTNNIEMDQKEHDQKKKEHEEILKNINEAHKALLEELEKPLGSAPRGSRGSRFPRGPRGSDSDGGSKFTHSNIRPFDIRREN